VLRRDRCLAVPGDQSGSHQGGVGDSRARPRRRWPDSDGGSRTSARGVVAYRETPGSDCSGRGQEVIWDITLSKAESASRRIESLRHGGYTVVTGLFVDSPVNVSLQRADARHRDGHDAYRAGTGLGGRFVADDVIRAQADSAWGSRNRANFEALK